MIFARTEEWLFYRLQRRRDERRARQRAEIAFANEWEGRLGRGPDIYDALTAHTQTNSQEATRHE